MNSQASFYGAAQNRITGANIAASQTIIGLKQQLSGKQDADATQAVLDLNSAMNNLQAAMAAEARLKPQSLFDYLG